MRDLGRLHRKIFEHEQLLQKVFDESAQIEAIQRTKEGLNDPFAPEMPIIGVPANYFFVMLDA